MYKSAHHRALEKIDKAHEHLKSVHPADHEAVRRAHDRVADAVEYERHCRGGVLRKESQ